MEHAEPDRDNRSNRSVLAASDRREEVDAFVIRNNNLASKGTIPFLRIVLLWLVFVGLIFGLLLSLVEKLPFLDAFWIAFNACTATGLTINNLAHFDVGGQALVALAMQLGSATLLSLTPVLIRIRSVHTILPEDVRSRTFNLKHYKRVPEWIIEYKALRILVATVVIYELACYAVFGTFIITSLYLYKNRYGWDDIEDDNTNTTATAIGTNANPFSASVFTTISAFNNVGYEIFDMSKLGSESWFISSINILVLAGNVMFPVLLRWIIIGLNYAAPRDSSRKGRSMSGCLAVCISDLPIPVSPDVQLPVYFRYLLFNGRKSYFNIFSSQQTWLLVIFQLSSIFIQTLLILIFSYDDLEFPTKQPDFWLHLHGALFAAINSRHSGFAMTGMTRFKCAILVVFVLMMFLAPVPFIVILNHSRTIQKKLDRSQTLTAESIHGIEESNNNSSESSLEPSTSEHAIDHDLYNRSGRLLNVKLAISPTDGHDVTVTSTIDAQEARARQERQDKDEEMWGYDIDTRLHLMSKYKYSRVPFGVRVRLCAYSQCWSPPDPVCWCRSRHAQKWSDTT